MGTICVRPAVPADARAVAAYHDRCFTSTHAGQLLAGEIVAPDPEDTRRQLRGRFEPNSGFETQVAVVDGIPVGHVTVRGDHLVHLFVDPAHQGTGLGRRLLALGETMITAGGHSILVLHTRVDNPGAIDFYKRAGWTVTGRVIDTVEHGLSYPEHVLTKHAAGSARSAAPEATR